MVDSELKSNGPGRVAVRGRSQKLDAAIAEATLHLLGTLGPGHVSIEAVAREVGCSRSSIYRRYPTKESLIMAAALTQFASTSPPQAGNLAWLIRNRASSFGDTARVLAINFLMDQALRGTELGHLYLEAVFGPVRLARAGVLSGAISRGEIRPDVDIDLLLDVISGALLFRVAHHPDAEPDLPDRLIRMLARGVATEPAEPPEA